MTQFGMGQVLDYEFNYWRVYQDGLVLTIEAGKNSIVGHEIERLEASRPMGIVWRYKTASKFQILMYKLGLRKNRAFVLV